MPLNPDRYWWLVPLSLLAAFIWQGWTLPGQQRLWAPDAILLASIYWILRRPHRFGSGTAFLIGLFRDALEGSMLGQHALSLVVVSYFVLLFHQRLRMLAVWQQMLAVGALAVIYLMVGNWVQLLNHRDSPTLIFLLPALATALGWPVCYLLLRWLEHGRSTKPARA